MTCLSRSSVAVLAGALALGGMVLFPHPVSAMPVAQAPLAAPELRYEVGAVVPGGARGLNEAGDVAGVTNYPLDAFRWSEKGGRKLLPALPGQINSEARDLNDTGMVAGVSGREGIESPAHAVRWVNDVPKELGALEDGGQSQAWGINDAGAVVGEADFGWVTHGFIWTEETGMVDVTPNGGFSYALDINESGQVTGYSGSRAYRWENGISTPLEPAAGYAFSFGNAINDSGQVAGEITTADGNAERFARWTPEGEIQVLGGSGEHNRMFGINNAGTTVGVGVVAAGIERGVIYADGLGLKNIDDLLTTSKYQVMGAWDINDAGQILAYGYNRFTDGGVTLRLDPVTGPLMHEKGFHVTVNDRDQKAVARLRVVDKAGQAVAGARVEAAWYDGDQVVEFGATDRTDSRGRASLSRSTRGMGGVAICITEITHKKFSYVPADGGLPPCAQAG